MTGLAPRPWSSFVKRPLLRAKAKNLGLVFSRATVPQKAKRPGERVVAGDLTAGEAAATAAVEALNRG
jgi:hypothetical protein